MFSFKQPSEQDCLNAIGLQKKKPSSVKVEKAASESDVNSYVIRHKDLHHGKSFSKSLQKALIPDSLAFKSIPTPSANDWLTNHKEHGQSFVDFAHARRSSISDNKRMIYILPISFFEAVVPADVLIDLVEFATLFFGLPVKLLPTRTYAGIVTDRLNNGIRQVNASQVISEIRKLKPDDAFCLAAITFCDLYPEESWNFVFGLANSSSAVGVYSLARYLPGFFENRPPDTANLSSTDRAELLKRACLLMCHEIGHMFGLHHCIFYHCMMNGSNNFTENDSKPLHLCPVCLRKLQLACQFDVVQHYERLAAFCHSHGMTEQAHWYSTRAQSIQP